jgi:hypothetical protein
MGKTTYNNGQIHCSCGHTFSNHLETRLSDALWEDAIEDEFTDTELCVCPECGTQYSLEIKVEKTIEVVYQHIEEAGKSLDNDTVVPINAALKDRWIGEEASFYDDFECETIKLPDGIYQTGDKEYKVSNGVVVELYGLPSKNQLSLFEELLAS